MEDEDYGYLFVMILGGIGVLLGLSWMANQMDEARGIRQSGPRPYNLGDL